MKDPVVWQEHDQLIVTEEEAALSGAKAELRIRTDTRGWRRRYRRHWRPCDRTWCAAWRRAARADVRLTAPRRADDQEQHEPTHRVSCTPAREPGSRCKVDSHRRWTIGP